MTFKNKRLITFIGLLVICIPKMLSKDDLRKEIIYDGSEKFRQIKHSKHENIEKGEIILENGNSIKIQYVKNEIIFLADIGTEYYKIREIAKKYDGVIVGYIAMMESYQVEFLDCTYEELQDKIELFKSEEGIESKTVSLNYYVEIQAL